MAEPDPWAAFNPQSPPTTSPFGTRPVVVGAPPAPNLPQGWVIGPTGEAQPVAGLPHEFTQPKPEKPPEHWRPLTKDDGKLYLSDRPGIINEATGEIRYGPAPPKGSVDPATQQGQARSLLTAAGVDLEKGVDPVRQLIENSTSGPLESLGAKTYALSGHSTEGMQNIARLKTIVSDMVLQLTGGGLGNQVSDADRQFIMERVGNLADPTVPADQRIAAWEQVKQRMGNVLGVKPSDTPPSDPNAPQDQFAPATGTTRTENVRGPVEKQLASMLRMRKPSAEIRKYALENGFPQGEIEKVLSWRMLNPTYKGSYDVHQERIVPTTAYNRAMASPLAAGALAAVDAGTMGLTDEASGVIDALRTGQPVGDAINAADYSKQMLMGANPTASTIGSLVGGAGSMVGAGLGTRALLSGGAKGGLLRNILAWTAKNPVKGAALGDAAYGAGYGAGEFNDNRLLGAGAGAALGLGGSALGQGGMKLLGAGMTGVVNPAVDRLRARGIPLTVGEVLGGGWKKAQDAMTSVWGPGNMVMRRYNEGRDAMNRAAFQEAGDIAGRPVHGTGQAGLNSLNNIKTQAYSDALDPIQLDLVNDPQFGPDLVGVKAEAAKLPSGIASELEDAINYHIGTNAEPGAGVMSGPNFQEAYRGLSRAPKERTNKEAYKTKFGEITRGAQDALTSALERQNPGAFGDFLKANSLNRHLMTLGDAVEAAKNQEGGLFTPAQLNTAATANTRNFGGKLQAALGNKPFNQLAKDAQQVQSSKLPTSGSYERYLLGGLATGGLTGGAGGLGYAADGGEGAAEAGLGTMTILSLLGTKKGQKLLTAALLNRPDAVRASGTALRRNPQIGADILTGAGIPLLYSLSR